MRIVYFILGLSFLIFFHELGHFIFAKVFKVYVYEFSLFMGPKLFQIKKGETKYSIRLLPIGGYVSMAGENDTQSERNNREELEALEESVPSTPLVATEVEESQVITETVEFEKADTEKKKKKVEEPLPDVPFERTLPGIANWKKLIIMFAGPFFNIFLCFILMIGYFLSVPIAKVNVSEGSDAYAAGLRTGDEISGMYMYFYTGETFEASHIEPEFYGGAYLEEIEVYQSLDSVYYGGYEGLYNKLVSVYPDLTGAPTNLKHDIIIKTKDGQVHTIEKTYHPVYNEDSTGLDPTSYPEFSTLGITSAGKKLGFGRSIALSARMEVKMAGAIYQALGNLFSEGGLNNVAGPVGMYSIATTFMAEGFMYYMYFIAMISVNLGIMNLLPFPALDGGKIIITLVEMITRKKTPAKFENWLNTIGFFILIGFILLVTVKDIFF